MKCEKKKKNKKTIKQPHARPKISDYKCSTFYSNIQGI